MKKTSLLIVSMLVATAPAASQDAGALLKCPPIKNETARLSCFDAAMRASAGAAPAPVDGGSEITTSTKEVVAAPKAAAAPLPESYKLIDPADLYVAPGKYEGKPIEIRRMRCFHADKNEYRCGAPGSLTLTLFAPMVEPDSEREALENECGEVKKMMSSPKCSKTVRFVPLKHDEDIVNGYQKRVIVVSRSIEFVSSSIRGRR